MDVTIFDGRTTKPCSAAEAKAAANQPGIAWIDLRLQGDDSTPAQDLLQAVGIDSATAHQVLTRGLGTDFLMTPTDGTGCVGSTTTPEARPSRCSSRGTSCAS